MTNGDTGCFIETQCLPRNVDSVELFQCWKGEDWQGVPWRRIKASLPIWVSRR